ncbi:MAG: cytidine deaminase [Candidatus Lokiarchaeota archaeon]|nr:cytidine deaminase [Candidatus Lokiarchaeota archaeon]
MKRISKDEYFMEIAEVVSKRSTCIKRHVGAVLVKDSHILSTGYNGAPSGFKHCNSETCVRQTLKSGEKPELCRGVHAEINCIIQAAIHGTSILGYTTLYSTHFPCMNCLKLLINAGIKRIVYGEGYNMENKVKEEMVKESNLAIEKFE